MTKKINLLDDVTINKIAAGEVVEKPSSVVKELIENSIDANATKILVEIKDGGKELIKVSDNGDGINNDEVEKSFLRHATSKITCIDDLYSIYSLGFRGEALASIASVSRVSIITKTDKDNFATKVYKEGMNTLHKEMVASSKGTTLMVEDLFFNIPARKKFLKSSLSETIAITDIINKLIIGNPHIQFKYINNSKIMLTSIGDSNLKTAIRSVYGKEVYENLIYVENENELFSLSGYIGNNSIYKNNKSLQYIYVNNRYIQSTLIQRILSIVYKEMIPLNKHGICFLNFKINPDKIDINIHPAKLEIKFEEEEKIFKTLKEILYLSLINKPLIPTYKRDINYKKNNLSRPKIENSIYKKRLQEKNIQIDFLDIDKNSKLNTNNEYVIKEDSHIYQSKIPDIDIIGTVFNTYILGQYEKNIYLIDQHAAHERILYEKYINDFENQNITMQILLDPIIIHISNVEAIQLENKLNIFKDFGFEIELFGNNSIIVREVPNLFGYPQSKNFIIDLIDNINELNNNYQLKKRELASIACKKAINAKNEIKSIEIKKLIKDLNECKNSFTCPHGRPIIVKISKYELEKMFKRVL